MTTLIVPYVSEEYFGALLQHDYRNQWIEQVVGLCQLFLSRWQESPEILELLSSFTHLSSFTRLSGDKIPESIINETLNKIHDRLRPSATKFLEIYFSGPSAWTPADAKVTLLHCILTILEGGNFAITTSQCLIDMSCAEISEKLLENVPLSRLYLSALSRANNVLEKQTSNASNSITRDSFVKVANSISTTMLLFSVAGSDSLEIFASDIALRLEKLHEFARTLKTELENEENFLDANDVPDIERKYENIRNMMKLLQQTVKEVSETAAKVFSEESLVSLVHRLSEIKDIEKRLESFSSVTALISRLKNTIGISSGAFLALSLPLLTVWPALYSKYEHLATPILNISTSSPHNVLAASKSIDEVSPLFSLYCQSYAYYLSSRATDDDFYTKQTYLTLTQNKQVVNLFKNVISNRSKCYAVSSGQMPASTVSFYKNFNLLLIQLQSRNYMRTWALTDELLLPELKAGGAISRSRSATSVIAKYCPMLIPMMEKVKIFNAWISSDRQAHQEPGEMDDFEREFEMAGPSPAVHVGIRRGPLLLQDAFQKLMPLHSRLKEKVKVQFFSEDGTPEAGIDGGGLFRELFTEVVKQTFSPDFGLFSTTETHELYPNPHSGMLVDDSIRKFQFLGQLLGKCIYESVLVDLPFASFFLNLLQGHVNSVRDLASYDQELFRQLQQLLDLKHPEDLALTFEFGEKQLDGTTIQVELLDGGANRLVTNAKDVGAYVQLVADLRLNKSISAQAQAFKRGLSEIIDIEWLRLFTPAELSLAICGGGRLDVEDLRLNTEFANGFYAEHPTMLLLWEVLEEMSSEEQQAFLKFVTSISRPPLLGFSTLNPRLCIRLNRADLSFLPTANTCIHLLKLPPYPTKQHLREKLLYAINSGARFDLS